MENSFVYIENLGGDGWLRVKFDDGLIWPLPEYLQVLLTKSSDREEFKVLEGRFKGKTASVKKKGWNWFQWDWDQSYFEEEVHLIDTCVHKSAAHLTFYKKDIYFRCKGLIDIRFIRHRRRKNNKLCCKTSKYKPYNYPTEEKLN